MFDRRLRLDSADDAAALLGGRRKPLAGFAWIALTFALISIPLISFGYQFGRSQAGTTSELAVLALLSYSSIRLAWVSTLSMPRLTAGIFWLFMYVAMSVAPVAQLATNRFVNVIDPAYLGTAAGITLCAAFAFDLGALLAARNRQPSARDDRESAAREEPSATLILLSVAACLATLLYIRTLGGPSVFFTNRAQLQDQVGAAGLSSQGSQAAAAIVVLFGRVPVLVALIIWSRLLLHKSARTRGGLILWSALVALNVVVNNPIINSRYWSLTVLLGISLSLLGRHRGRIFGALLMIGAVAAIIIFPNADVYRNDDREVSAEVTIAERIATKDYDQWIMTSNGVWFTENFGHTDGRQLLGVALFWVPRSVWTEKPEDTGRLVGDYVRTAGTNNLSSPMWEELWLDGGWIAVILGLAVVGALSRRLDSRYLMSSTRTCLVPLLAGYSFILLRGPLLQATAQLAVLIASCLILERAVKRRIDDAPRST